MWNPKSHVEGSLNPKPSPSYTPILQGVHSALSEAIVPPGSGTSVSQGLAPPALVLLLAKLCAHLESTALPCALEATAAAFEGAGGGRGADQPPAFVPAHVAR